MEKIHLMEERQLQLDMTPTANLEYTTSGGGAAATESYPFRRRLLQGTFRHDKEVLIGPRGAPPGVKMEVKGLSAKSGKKTQGSGMSAGPQGYHVLTPLELAPGTADREMVWVNRGWVPKTMVPGADKPYARQGPVEQAKIQAALAEPPAWERPKGTVTITAVKSEVEKPKFMTPQHDYSKRPLQLFWFDGVALQAIAESDKELLLMTEVLHEETTDKDEMDASIAQQLRENTISYPLQPPVTAIYNFRTTPEIHVGYAVTWFGLSAAGVYMTRKLISKGRF
jgi:surfeit locus 1 family protein